MDFIGVICVYCEYPIFFVLINNHLCSVLLNLISFHKPLASCHSSIISSTYVKISGKQLQQL